DKVIQVVALAEQIEAGHGREVNVDVAGLLVDRLRGPGEKIAAEPRPGDLDLTVEDDVERSVGEALGAERRVRAADDDELAAALELPRELERAPILDVPAADGDDIGVRVEPERVAVLVLQLDGDLRRGQRGHRGEAKRRLPRAHADQVRDALDSP